MDRHAFCRRFIQALQESEDQEPDFFSTSERLEIGSDGMKGVLSLAEAYADVEIFPPVLQEARLRHWAAHLAVPPPPLPASWNEARPLLCAGLVSSAGLAFRRWLDGLPSPPTLPGPGGLRRVVCLDGPRRLRHLSAENLKAWGVDLPTAWACAFDNLRARPAPKLQDVDKDLWILRSGDGYDAARLLDPDALRLPGDLIALPVRRDALLLADATRPEALRRMGALALREIRQERRLSGLPLRRSGSEWSAWRVSRDHPAYPELRWLEASARFLDYREQQSFWRASFSEGPVGKVRGIVLDSNERVLGAEWPEGWPGLLCQGDVVLFRKLAGERPHRPHLPELREPEAERGSWIEPRADEGAFSELLPDAEDLPWRVPWEALLEVAGNLLVELPGSAPPRWRVRGPLNPAQELALAAYSL